MNRPYRFVSASLLQLEWPPSHWGLLAVVGEIDPTSARESYQHWAALLCASLEAKRLEAAVRKAREVFG